MSDKTQLIQKPPVGLAVFALVGPALVWCAEYIGSGEVILATRTGAILGTSVIWAVIAGIFLKYWIGMSGARYTVCTGEGMMDMFSRIPGPKNWSVWIILFAQLIAGIISIGSIATAGGAFINSLLPFIPRYFCGWFVTLFALSVVWKGGFSWIKMVMSFLVFIVIAGVFYVSVHAIPQTSGILAGLIPGRSVVPEWAIARGVGTNPWREILPLLGWGAGGFASQVWYTYWVLGAGYGAAHGKSYGKPADVDSLRKLNAHEARQIKGWCKVVYTDATLAMLIGIGVTCGFLIAGAGILGTRQLAPEGPQVGIILSQIFSAQWGQLGGFLFLLGGTAALLATQVGQMAGWPRLLADAFRICIPKFGERFSWKMQFRIFLILFLITSMIIIYTMGLKPVFLVKIAAVLDGLLLTPLQALLIGIALYAVMPGMFNEQSKAILRPHWIFGAGLLLAFLVFGYFCVFQIPFILF